MFDMLPLALPRARGRCVPSASPRRGAWLPRPTCQPWRRRFRALRWASGLLSAPPGTPQPIIERLDASTRSPRRTCARFAELGLEPFPAGPEELDDLLAAEIRKWVRVVRGADIRLD